LSHHANIEVHEDHLIVVQEGALESVPQAEALQQRVESRCQEVGCRRVVFDNRKTTAHPDDVRAAMFDWATTHFEKVALLLESDMIGVRANMEALSRGAKLRAFHDLAEAVAWLRR
jgi:hypothetical protein